MDYRFVIPSRRRPLSVSRMEAMFPGALWVLDEVDAKEYAIPKDRILVQPKHTLGLPKTKQWVLDTIPDKVVCFLDDDIKFLFIQCGLVGRRTYDSAVIRHVVDQALGIALELGTSLFGFATMADVRKFRATEPFNLKTWCAGFMGVIGRRYRFNTKLKSRADIDYALRVLEGDRFIWADHRFAFSYDSFRRPGGATGLRTSETDQSDMTEMKREWGRYLTFKSGKNGVTPSLSIDRKQPLNFE